MLAHATKHHSGVRGPVRQAVTDLRRKIKQRADSLAQQDHDISSESSRVNEVLEIRLDENIAWVQPNVTMGTLVEATMGVGLIPTVVPHSRDTTVAEAFVTETFGSSSFRYGTFDCAVLSVKRVCCDGREVVIKLNDGNAGAPQSLDSITLLEVALISAGEYVEMTYWPVRCVSGAALRMEPKGPGSLIVARAAVDEFTDFLDVVMLGPARGFVVTGRFMYTADHNRSRFAKSVPFVQHVESILYDKLKYPGDVYVETVPLVDYLFRYHGCSSGGDSSRPQDFSGLVQNVTVPAEDLQKYIEDSYWQKSTCPVSITQAEPHSTFGRHGQGIDGSVSGDRWHIRALRSPAPAVGDDATQVSGCSLHVR
ncbi:hypothetical protein AALT_g11067 [Alternaria alternata]|nr:hypothetical protein AALT_g11067 [Alternaria alternata]